MSTEKIYAAIMKVARHSIAQYAPGGAHLDVGAGRGQLVRAIKQQTSLTSYACDSCVELFAVPDVPCSEVNLNHSALPYGDSEFELVTCSEVIEHVENYRALLREAFRVTKGGGVLIVSTPNVLNIKSRLRYLICGFANLFGPLPVYNKNLGSTAGHITPIPFFYLAHAMACAGFEKIALRIDKIQKTSVLGLALLFPLIGMSWLYFIFRERRRFQTINADNEAMIAPHFSWRILVGRTIVVSAMKPKEELNP
jgi:SAM-dependent methyltransferase